MLIRTTTELASCGMHGKKRETQEEVKNDRIKVTLQPMRYADKTTMIEKKPDPFLWRRCRKCKSLKKGAESQ